jgi:hypothetical protein
MASWLVSGELRDHHVAPYDLNWRPRGLGPTYEFQFFSATTCMEYGHKFDFFSLYARLPVKIPQADE